jgi:glutathione S-transferase
MRLHNNLQSGNSYKVRLLLRQLGRSYENVAVDIFKGESRTASFMKLNPAGQTPVLELDDGTMLPESNAILCYLAEGTDLYPSPPVERAHILRWMFFEQNNVMPNIGWARFIKRWMPEDSPMQERLPWLQENGAFALAVMEGFLTGRHFFAGDRYTIADIALYGYSHTAPEGRPWARSLSGGRCMDEPRPEAAEPHTAGANVSSISVRFLAIFMQRENGSRSDPAIPGGKTMG